MIRKAFQIVILAILLLFFFHDIVFLGKSFSSSSFLPGSTPLGPYGFSGHRPSMPFSFDTAGNAWVNEPNPYIINRILEGKSPPVWNPHEGAGMPLISNPNNEVLNPLKFFLNYCPGPFAQDIFFLLRLFIMGIFTCFFLMEMQLGRVSSLLGSVFFMLSGYSVWWINLHPLSTVMYLPAVFYFYERWYRRKDTKSAFFMALCLSCAFFGGKMPDVLMGLCLLIPYALWKGMMNDSISGLFREGRRVGLVVLSGVLMASAALFPFVELYSQASPLAKAIRTGAASHTIPLITSVSLLQPLFLGRDNYFYGAWLTWIPQIVLPHASVVVLLLSLYSVTNRATLKTVFPFLVFSAVIFSIVYGILPAHLISRLPVFGSIEFLKYNALFYFSLAVMAAYAFESLLSGKGERKMFYLSGLLVSIVIMIYFFLLQGGSPPAMKGYMTAVLLFTLSGIALITVVFRFSREMHIWGGLVFFFLIMELYLYMPKDHPDRGQPYQEPPYTAVIKGAEPYRITGSGNCVPPLVSNALGLYDARAISVLMPRNYYLFSEKLMGFSVPQTNNPNSLFTATSPFTDLMGVKYILSGGPLERQRLEHEVRSQIASLRWIRFFDSMIRHSIRGKMVYGFFEAGGENRFSFHFPEKFMFETRLNVAEPYLFAGFALKDMHEGASAPVKIAIDGNITEVVIRSDKGWQDQWIDISAYAGKAVTISLQSDREGAGTIVLGNFGLSPGQEKEAALYKTLLNFHEKELPFLEYRGVYEGMHIYENKNVMERAFVVHKVKMSGDINAIFNELQEGADFREIGLVSDTPGLVFNTMHDFPTGIKDTVSPRSIDNVIIRSYSPQKITVEAASSGGLLVVTDLFYPGWRAVVNGKEQEVIKVFGIFRGVVIGEGKSEILFSYRPMSLYIGGGISAATFLAWIVYMGLASRKKRARHE